MTGVEGIAAIREGRTVDPAPAIRPRLVSVASGKGGVGKTMICLGVAWYLARMGYRVVAVDVDFGVGNLHLSAGLGRVDRSLDEFFSGSTDDLGQLAIPVADNGRLSILAAGGRCSAVTDMPEPRMRALLERIRGIDADYVLLDIGAGSSQSNVECFVQAHHRMGVTTGDLSSMAALTALMRKARVQAVLHQVMQAFPQASYLSRHGYASISAVFAAISDQDDAGVVLPVAETAAKNFDSVIILNRARDADVGQIQRINSSLGRHINTDRGVSGIIPEDDAVNECRRRGLNFLSTMPSCGAARALAKVTHEWHQASTVLCN